MSTSGADLRPHAVPGGQKSLPMLGIELRTFGPRSGRVALPAGSQMGVVVTEALPTREGARGECWLWSGPIHHTGPSNSRQGGGQEPLDSTVPPGEGLPTGPHVQKYRAGNEPLPAPITVEYPDTFCGQS
ncbi:hypothetical protein Bbelb_128510 [Branchiostoma belcheri]|nr:hypothetical protein Bbelb_128510 [Branchiostoma belcheri]